MDKYLQKLADDAKAEKERARYSSTNGGGHESAVTKWVDEQHYKKYVREQNKSAIFGEETFKIILGIIIFFLFIAFIASTGNNNTPTYEECMRYANNSQERNWCSELLTEPSRPIR